jgi:hypothetical protein
MIRGHDGNQVMHKGKRKLVWGCHLYRIGAGWDSVAEFCFEGDVLRILGFCKNGGVVITCTLLLATTKGKEYDPFLLTMN